MQVDLHPEAKKLIKHPLFFSLQGWRRRALFLISSELLAIGCSSLGLSFLSDQSISHSSVMAVTCSVVAVLWNWLFNHWFEIWEHRQPSAHRTVMRRILHALGFEIPLLVIFIALFAWWFQITYVKAFLMDIAMTVFFLVGTFVFTWGFDSLFGQPKLKQTD